MQVKELLFTYCISDDIISVGCDFIDNKQKQKFLINLTKSKSKVFKVITILILLITLSLTVAYFYLQNKEQPETVYAISTNEENKFVEFDVHYLTDCIATYTHDSIVDKYYFAKDDDYIVIAKLTDNEITDMEDIIKYTYGEIDTKPEYVTITGTNEKIPTELKEIALEAYNEMFVGYEITEDEFEDYLGACYINTSITPYTNIEIFIIIFVFFGYLYIFFVIIFKLTWYIKSKSNINKITKSNELDDIYSELNNELAITKLNEQDIILTENYLIDHYRFFQTIKYTDIVWIYEYSFRYNGVETRCIKLLDKNRKIKCIGYKNSTNKNYELIHNLLVLLQQKCPKALVGYSKENIKATNKKNFKDTVEKMNNDLYI